MNEKLWNLMLKAERFFTERGFEIECEVCDFDRFSFDIINGDAGFVERFFGEFYFRDYGDCDLDEQLDNMLAEYEVKCGVYC